MLDGEIVYEGEAWVAVFVANACRDVAVAAASDDQLFGADAMH